AGQLPSQCGLRDADAGHHGPVRAVGMRQDHDPALRGRSHRLPGRLSVGDEVWQDDATGKSLEPHERAVGYVFQEASLFTHLSVLGNLRYGYRRALRKGAVEEIRFDEIVSMLGIGHLLKRATGQLSGGERQRVAIGRALSGATAPPAYG